jgi:hypothetical protein
MKKQRIVVLLSVVALMVVMLAFSVATAAIAQGQGEQKRTVACGHAGAVHVPFGCTS